MPIALVTQDHPSRQAAEACAREVFKRAYNADLRDFPALLVASRSLSGEVEAVAGVRTAWTGFFSERYLPAPIESLLVSPSGQRADRDAVIEFTTLASRRPAAVLSLIESLRTLALHWGFEWAFFTATARLRFLLRMRDIPLVELARADASRLSTSSDWGSYYGTQPAVCAVHATKAEVFCPSPSSGGMRPQLVA